MKTIAVRVLSLVLSLLLTGSSACAELTWDAPFPTVPADLAAAYSAQPRMDFMQMAEAALETLGVAESDVSREENWLFAWIGAEDSGERTTLRCDEDGLHYGRDTKNADAPVDHQTALHEATELANALLGTAVYRPEDARIEPYYDESGALNPHLVDIVWERRTAQGVTVHDLKTTATYARGMVTSLHCWDAQLTEADAPTDYVCPTADEALARLNFAIAHIDPAHTCTSFDDPSDPIERIDLVYTRVFSSDGLYTPAWAFVRRDAQNHWLKSPVLVDMITGDVWDGHDGRMKGGE